MNERLNGTVFCFYLENKTIYSRNGVWRAYNLQFVGLGVWGIIDYMYAKMRIKTTSKSAQQMHAKTACSQTRAYSIHAKVNLCINST